MSMESIPDERFEQRSTDGASTISIDDHSDLLDGDVSFSHTQDTHGDEVASSSDGSSPLGWPLGRRDRPSAEPSPTSSKRNSGRDTFMWEEKREKRETELSGTFSVTHR